MCSGGRDRDERNPGLAWQVDGVDRQAAGQQAALVSAKRRSGDGSDRGQKLLCTLTSRNFANVGPTWPQVVDFVE
jgi:hypothetical protein